MKWRRTLDERGNPILEKRNRDGLYERELNRSAICKLDAGSLSFVEPSPSHAVPQGSTPYGDKATLTRQTLKKRSSLDYLRQLSREIERRNQFEKKD